MLIVAHNARCIRPIPPARRATLHSRIAPAARAGRTQRQVKYEYATRSPKFFGFTAAKGIA
jgi:hypothetical protein